MLFHGCYHLTNLIKINTAVVFTETGRNLHIYKYYFVAEVESSPSFKPGASV